jgi:hypothetical protein
MRSSRSVLIRTIAVTAAVGLSLVTASPAMAGGGDTLLRDGFEGNIPLTVPDTDPPAPNPDATPIFGGVAPAGAPWVLDDDSEVRVRENGRIKIELDDLVIPDREPVERLVAASLLCDDVVVASTRAFELDDEGDGEFEGRIRVPRHCDDPRVLIRNANDPAALGGYFAFTQDERDRHHHHKHHR